MPMAFLSESSKCLECVLTQSFYADAAAFVLLLDFNYTTTNNFFRVRLRQVFNLNENLVIDPLARVSLEQINVEKCLSDKTKKKLTSADLI